MALCNLHVLRDVGPVGGVYLLLWALALAVVVIDALDATRRRPFKLMSTFGVWIWIGITGWIASLATMSLYGAFFGLARFWFSMPILLAIVAYCHSRDDLKRFTGYAVIFFALATLTIPMQLVTGPVSWFHEESTRGGLDRYPSILGGLNAAGGIAGAYIVLAQVLKPRARLLAVAAIALSVTADLSKSGIVSVGMGLALLAILNIRRIWAMSSAALLFIGLGYVAYSAFPTLRARLATTLISFGLKPSAGLHNSDSTVTESANERLTSLPLENLMQWQSLHSPVKYPFGGGFGMASTALAPPGDSLAKMSHNQFVEILTVFGVVGFVAYLAAWTLVVYRLNSAAFSPRSPDKRFARIYLVAMLVILGRFFFANGALYHPASATALHLCVMAAAWTLDGKSRQPHRGRNAPDRREPKRRMSESAASGRPSSRGSFSHLP